MGKQIKKKLEGIKFKSFKKKEENLPQCYLQAEIAHLVLTRSMQMHQKASWQDWMIEENHQKDLMGLGFHEISLPWTGNR